MPPNPSRRSLLATIPVVGTAGCLSDENEIDEIGEITILNLRDEPAEVTVTVKRGDEQVVENRYSLVGRDGDIVDGETVLESLSTESDEIVVEVNRTGGETESVSTVDIAGQTADVVDLSDESCVLIQAQLRADRIRFLYTANC